MEFFMKLNHFLSLGILSLALLTIVGCARYQARPLDRVAPHVNGYQQENNVSLAYRVFNHHDCKRYLDRDVLAKGYQPIHVTITNSTNRAYDFSLNSLNVLCVDAREVAEKVHTSTAKRVASYGIGSLFLPVLIIPAIVDGVGSSEANRQLDFDFDNKALENQIIPPYGTANGIIFTPVKNAHRNLVVTLVDMENGQKLVLS